MITSQIEAEVGGEERNSLDTLQGEGAGRGGVISGSF